MYSELKNQIITGILSSPIIYVPHFHYYLVDEVIMEIISPSLSNRRILDLCEDSILEYSLSEGIIDFVSKERDRDLDIYSNLYTYLSDIVENKSHFDTEKIFIFKNFSHVIDDPKIQSLLKLYVEKYEKGDYDNLTTIIIVDEKPISELPLGIEKLIKVIDILAPNEKEIHDYIISLGLGVSKHYSEQEKIALIKNLTRTLQGLQFYEIKQIINSSIIRTSGVVSDKTISIALEEKKNIVKKSGVIEVIDTDVTFEQVGGLENLKTDLQNKAKIYKHLSLAADMAIPLPKGILIIGMPGCGKSMIAKSIAEKFGVSLLRLDINRLMGQYVGQSEQNLRRALETAEAAHPCVLWIDEIEKAFAGSSGRGDNDMLVTRLMGHFLTWMQERKTAVYIVATANDIMRPEFMRKGRFDEVYFVDFPTCEERIDIIKKKIQKYDNDDSIFDFSEIRIGSVYKKEALAEISKAMSATDPKSGGFSGSEIESVVNMVIESKFIEYITAIESGQVIPSIKITVKDFIEKVSLIKDAAMCNQKGKKQERTDFEKTNIDRIRDIQSVYKFRNASKFGNQKK